MIKSKKFWITILIVMVGNGMCYWFLKLFQSNYHYIYFFLDDKIPFLPRFIYIYNLFYPVVFISYYLMFKKGNEETFMNCAVSSVVGCFICYIIFLCYPTIIDHGIIPSTDKLTKFAIDITYFFDNPAINCFPSIHCLFCFQVIYGLFKSKKFNNKLRIFLILFLLLIAISTVIVKQHYFVDIIGGFVVCVIANVITIEFDLYKKIKKKYKIFA